MLFTKETIYWDLWNYKRNLVIYCIKKWSNNKCNKRCIENASRFTQRSSAKVSGSPNGYNRNLI